jgi:hypothetical protein
MRPPAERTGIVPSAGQGPSVGAAQSLAPGAVALHTSPGTRRYLFPAPSAYMGETAVACAHKGAHSDPPRRKGVDAVVAHGRTIRVARNRGLTRLCIRIVAEAIVAARPGAST